MKRILFLLTVIGALASCTDNEISEVNPVVKGNEISFNTMRDKVETRYANDNKSDYQVYGIIAGQTTSNWFINNIILPGVGKNGTDSIENGASYYWPGGDTNVYFFAFAPAYVSGTSSTTGITAVNATTTQQSGTELPTIDISYTVPDGAQEDFTIAIPRKQYAGQVNFTFQHMLSKITFNVDLSEELTKAGYEIIGDVTGAVTVPYNTSSIDAAYSYNATTSPTPTWGTLSLSGTATYTGYSSFNIMPQSYTAGTADVTGNCVLQITQVKIGGGSGTDVFSGALLEYTVQDGDITGNAFEMGKNYNVTFTITELSKDSEGGLIFDSKIVFTSTVSSWTSSGVSITQP